MKRKILTLTMASVACVTALTMAGCGKKQEATQETATQEAATEEVATQIDLPINTETEKKVQCVIFVATLAYSNATFVKVLRSQGMELFLHAIIDACDYFGAVAPI